MKKIYRRVKIFTVFVFCFIMITLGPVIIYDALNNNWTNIFLALIPIIGLGAIATFNLLYNRNVVIEVTFEGNNTIIKTNGKVYILPSENFTEVNDSNSYGRTFITYDDGETKKKFIFEKRYSPFKIYSLDIDEMRSHMIWAIFKKT